MMNSIIQSKKECYVCHRQGVLHKHHVFGGSNRKNSERYGMTVWLCPADHNMSDITQCLPTNCRTRRKA